MHQPIIEFVKYKPANTRFLKLLYGMMSSYASTKPYYLFDDLVTPDVDSAANHIDTWLQEIRTVTGGTFKYHDELRVHREVKEVWIERIATTKDEQTKLCSIRFKPAQP